MEGKRAGKIRFQTFFWFKSSRDIEFVADSSAGIGHGPIFVDRTNVGDDFPVVRPRHLDGIVGADTSATRIARRAEPVVLRGTRSASAPSIVGSSIDGVTKDVVGEDGVVRDDSSCQVVRNALTDVKNGLDLTVAILRNNLERSEQLSCQKLSLLLTTEVLQRDINCSWLPCAIFLWDRVVLQRSASEKDLSAVEL